jgi:hypothetical protein
MTTYIVQFTLPVDNPGSNVVITRANKVVQFDVPINHPDAHNMGFMDLIAAAELSHLSGLPTELNKTVLDYERMISKAKRLASGGQPEKK